MTVPQVGDNCVVSTGKPFNLGVSFADFLADETRTELTLPPMTTEQRKEAKRFAEQYPEIKCESYGFGEERRLHLFKKQNGAAPTGLTRTGSEQSTTASEVDTPSPANTSLHEVNFGSVLSERIQIKNTFIHVEENSDFVDGRMVQSMPHGMFGKRWEEEVLQKMPGDAKTNAAKQMVPQHSQEEVRSVSGSDASYTGSTKTEEAPPKVAVPPPAKEAPRGIFAIGSDVVVEGLMKCPAFNGLSGKVESLDEKTGRYEVMLVSNSGNDTLAKIKGENLRIAVPPPPTQRPEDFHRVAPIAQAPEVPAPTTMCGGFQMPAQPCWYEPHFQQMQQMQHMQQMHQMMQHQMMQHQMMQHQMMQQQMQPQMQPQPQPQPQLHMQPQMQPQMYPMQPTPPFYAHHPHDPYMYAPVCPAR